MILRRWHVIGIPLACAILFGLSVPWWLQEPGDDVRNTVFTVFMLLLSAVSHIAALWAVIEGVVLLQQNPTAHVITLGTPKPPPPDPSKPGGEVSEIPYD